MYDDLHLWFKFGQTSAKEHLKYRLNLLWRSHIVRSEKIEVLFELDNLLYFMESSILQSGAHILQEIQDALKEHLGETSDSTLKKSPILLGSWIGGDRDGNPYVTNRVMIEVMKHQHQTIIQQYLKYIDKLIRELSIAQEYANPSNELLESLEKDKEHLDTLAKSFFCKNHSEPNLPVCAKNSKTESLCSIFHKVLLMKTNSISMKTPRNLFKKLKC